MTDKPAGFGHPSHKREIWAQLLESGAYDSFLKNMEINEGVFPAISDSGVGSMPDQLVMFYLNRNFRMGVDKYEDTSLLGKTSDNRICVMMVFPNSSSINSPVHREKKEDEQLRSFFDLSGVLTVRPLANSNCRMGVTIKGGNNMEHHNHNDVGSYTVVLGREIMAGDPGSIPYTANIFNTKYRYTYKTIGSYGHPEKVRPLSQIALLLQRRVSLKRQSLPVVNGNKNRKTGLS